MIEDALTFDYCEGIKIMPKAPGYRKSAHCILWFGDKIVLAKVIKKCWHQNLYGDAGGKIEPYESIIDGLIREIKEETDLDIDKSNLILRDCYVYEAKKLKTFLFETHLTSSQFNEMKNTEPTKLGPWQLFTVEKALRLPLMPSLKHYLNNL